MNAQSELSCVRPVDAELLLQEIRSDRRVTILDVRTSAEFHGPSGRIRGARSIPMHQLAGRCEEIGCHRSQPVVTVSGRDGRSRMAALELELAGFTEVRALEGGMSRWLDLGFPVEQASCPPRTLGLPASPAPRLSAPPR